MLKHAQAQHVVVTLRRDDGTGCCWRSRTTESASIPRRPSTRSRRLGLTSMEERAQRLGGTLEIRSAAGRGTTIRLKAPGG